MQRVCVWQKWHMPFLPYAPQRKPSGAALVAMGTKRTHTFPEASMNRRYALAAAAVMGAVLIAHSILAFTKMRWVTGLLELIAAAVFFWQVLVFKREVAVAPSAPPR